MATKKRKSSTNSSNHSSSKKSPRKGKQSTPARVSKSSSAYRFTHTQISIAVALVLIIGIAALFMFFSARQSELAARVGNEAITMAELTAEYDALDEGTRGIISKGDYLTEVMIPNRMLLQRAQGVSDVLIQEVYDEYVTGSGMSEDELFSVLEMQGVTKARFNEMVRIQAYIIELFGSELEVSDAEVDAFYQEQQHLLESEDISEAELRMQIKSFLESQLIQDALMLHLEELEREIPVTVYYGDSERVSAPTVGTFRETGDAVCTEGGKPVVRMFSTTWCPHCGWIKDTYKEVVQEYVDRGEIVAYLWEVDTQEEALSGTAGVPDTEMALFQKYNPRGGVPTFVFGCAYVREGNGYEHQDDLAAERAEFRQIIDMLIA